MKRTRSSTHDLTSTFYFVSQFVLVIKLQLQRYLYQAFEHFADLYQSVEDQVTCKQEKPRGQITAGFYLQYADNNSWNWFITLSKTVGSTPPAGTLTTTEVKKLSCRFKIQNACF